jgi:TolA-binding protein
MKQTDKWTYSDKPLTRKEIQTYLTSEDEDVKAAIERKAAEHTFESTALEGWSSQPMLKHSMHKLDKRFASKTFFGKGTAMFVLIILTLLWVSSWMYFSKDQSVKSSERRKIVQSENGADHHHTIIPDSIQQMTVLPPSKSIQPQTLKADFSQMRQQHESTEQEAVEFLDFSFPETTEGSGESRLKSQVLLGKELYIHDLKALDYRAYRSSPALRLNEPVMTGTPANNDPLSSETESNPRTVNIPYMPYLEKTMQLFSNNHMKLSVARFEVILETYPDDLNANFYAGLCYFNLQSYDKAITYFHNCLDAYFQNFDEEAEWYLAKSYVASKQTRVGTEWLEKIIRRGGFYAKQAEKMLNGLHRSQQ